MKEWKIDLHLHSVLSPCASEEMIPPRVLEQAQALGLDAIAVTDHNTVLNAGSFIEKGRELGIKVFPGMELQTREDVHLVCLFASLRDAYRFSVFVYNHLPPLANNKKSLGEQWIVDKEGNKTAEEERLLLVGTDLTVEQGIESVHHFQGLCLAAHIDRQAFSLWGHLGSIPQAMGLDGIELTPHLPRIQKQLEEIKQEGYSIVVSSDAHYLGDMRTAGCTALMERCTFEELRLALRRENGRCIRTLR